MYMGWKMLEAEPLTATRRLQTSEVRQVIERTWAEMMPFAQLDESVAWRETGVDSLLTLQFLVRLEQALKCPLSFDMFTLDMTVGQIIAAIERSQSAGAPKAPVQSEHDITLFLVPGLFGDEPILAEFRRSLAGKVRFETLNLPDIAQPAEVIMSPSRTGDFLVRQIVEKQPEGPLHIAGFSIGGMMAFEAANTLRAMGREVKFLGLLDSFLAEDLSSGSKYGQTMREAAPHTQVVEPNIVALFKRRGDEDFATYSERLIYGAMMRLNLFEPARRLVVKHWDRHSLEANMGRRRRLIQALRGRAAFLWRPQPCPVPTLLIASDAFEAFFTPEAWRKYCPNLTIQRVPGVHAELFSPPALAKLNPALLAALGAPLPAAAKAA
jgi:thioesterase domain-containing protein/acyl carrier protein